MENQNYQTGCRYFNGYKPCGKSEQCDELCPQREKVASNVLILHLGAIGAVVRTTSLLKEIKRKHPNSKVIWLTSPVIKPLLVGHPLIDEVYASDFESITEISNYTFDIVYSIDKSKFAGGILRQLNFEALKGFYVDENGKVRPADKDAHYLWENGLSDHLKFHVNKKSEIEMIFEALGLNFNKNEYDLPLKKEEEELAKEKRMLWKSHPKQKLIGINTGCSPHIPYKKLSYSNLLVLIQGLKQNPNYQIVLLGGPEDHHRNERLAKETGVIASPCKSGLRDGLTSIRAVDLVISGDSLGMHMAISQEKWLIAWFGPTCAHEIELYGRGEKIVSKMTCSPCWKRDCQKKTKCNDVVEIEEILYAVDRAMKRPLPDTKQIAISSG